MKNGLLFSVAFVAALTITASAQDNQSGYHTVACIKVKPGKTGEFEQFAKDSVHKLVQARADAGKISAWFLLGSVMPQGRSAACDYHVVSIYPGQPPAPMGMEDLGVTLKKAGIGLSAQEFIEKRASVTDLVSLELWQNQIAVGTLQKGDYLYLNLMKVPKVGEWIESEKKIWQPMAEQWTKDGGLHGWFLNVAVLPGGTERKYQAATVDVFPSWEAAMKYGGNIADTFRKVHPGEDLARTFEHISATRDLAVQELLSVDDVVRPAEK